MLPSNLLRARISGAKIRPLYVRVDRDTIALAEKITIIFGGEVGRRKGELLERLREAEDESSDFKLVRGLSALLERRCLFEAESAIDPRKARMAVFEEASRAGVTTPEERSDIIGRVSNDLGVSVDLLERTLYSDIDEELVLKDFEPIDPATLLRRYNLSLTQTLLFKALRVDFSASGNWKSIFREVKRLGLIYTVEKGDGDANGGAKEAYTVSLDGPLSLFKMTERYGTSIAKLLPKVTVCDAWRIKAEILVRSRGGRVYSFEANSDELGVVMNVSDSENGEAPTYDSSVEEKFARSFVSYDSGWTLRREPEPLLAGRHVLIPDFGFQKHGLKVYLEVVGFWTPEYLERKINKLNSVAGVDMIIAADESLACSKLERLRGKALVLYYRKEVPVRPIVDHLREREASVFRAQAEALSKESIILKGDVVSLADIAKDKGVSVDSVRMALSGFTADGYVRAGDLFLSKTKLDEIERKLVGVEKLADALAIIEASGVRGGDGQRVLESLGYTSVWEGMEMDKVKISRRPT